MTTERAKRHPGTVRHFRSLWLRIQKPQKGSSNDGVVKPAQNWPKRVNDANRIAKYVMVDSLPTIPSPLVCPVKLARVNLSFPLPGAEELPASGVALWLESVSDSSYNSSEFVRARSR